MVYNPLGFLSECTLSQRFHDDIKVRLVQSQDPDVTLISQIDIVMCFSYDILAMSWQYRG